MATPVLLALDSCRRGAPRGTPTGASGRRRDEAGAGAEALRPYIDAGFTGFTFNNPVLATPESIAFAGEVLRLIA